MTDCENAHMHGQDGGKREMQTAICTEQVRDSSSDVHANVDRQYEMGGAMAITWIGNRQNTIEMQAVQS